MRSEAAVQSHVMLAMSEIGIGWRNNSGVAIDETGRHIRYGLANSSHAANQHIKSSDIIGIVPVTAYLQSVGWCTLGVFAAIECKAPGWKFSEADKRAVAQARFHDIVRGLGGFAGFVSDPAEIHSIIRRA